MEMKMLGVKYIDPDPDQPRLEIHEDETQQLAASIRDQNQLQPIIVFCTGERFQLVDGHRRFAAVCLLGRDAILGLVLPSKPNAATLLATQLTANCMRKDLTPMEKARGIERLKKLRNFSNVEVANALHMGEAAVTQCLSYLSLPPDVQSAIDTGKIGGSTAYAITRAKDDETKQTLLEAARNGTLSRDDALQAVRKPGTSHAKTTRIACRLPGKTVTVTSETRLSVQDLESVWQSLLQESKRASKQGLDVVTFERVLADKSRLAV